MDYAANYLTLCHTELSSIFPLRWPWSKKATLIEIDLEIGNRTLINSPVNMQMKILSELVSLSIALIVNDARN